MELLTAFVIAFVLSFVGTIPPGTISLTVVQLGLDQRIGAAWRMALAASLVEYPYAWIAVEFQDLLTRSVELTKDFHLLSGIVMILLGLLNLRSASRSAPRPGSFRESGFRRGIVLGLLNPLAIPFWVAITAYLKTYGWVNLSRPLYVHAYLSGVSAGTFVLLVLVAYLARRVVQYMGEKSAIKKIPGAVLILLGIYSFIRYAFE